MRRFNKLESGNIEMNTLLSSRTYYNHNGYNKCIYCDKQIESDDWLVWKDKENNSHWVSPTKCDCDKAKEELNAKLELINKLDFIDLSVDNDKINQLVLEEKIKELKETFEQDK